MTAVNSRSTRRSLVYVTVGSLWETRLFFLLFTIYTGYLFWSFWEGPQGKGFDLMILTGGGACIVGLYFGLDAKPRLHRVISALKDNGVLSGTADQVARLHERIDSSSVRSGWLGVVLASIFEAFAVFVALFIVPFVIYPWMDGGVFPSRTSLRLLYDWGLIDASKIVGTLAITVGPGAIVGWGLGRFAAYGKFQQEAEAVGCGFRVQPGSADGMGGLQPLVNFLRGQAILTLMPTLWIGVWLILTCINSNLFTHYGMWRASFLILFGLSVFYGRVGFLAPARLIEQALAAQEDAATGFSDATLREEVVALLATARHKIIPRSGHFHVSLGLLVIMIVASGFMLPSISDLSRLILFLIGPRQTDF
jgi:hypothetical protein